MESHENLMSDIMDEMDPRVLDFIRKHVTSFTRWDTLRFLSENPHTCDTAEHLAMYVGRAPHLIVAEAQQMAEQGILNAEVTGGHTVYSLTDNKELRQIIAAIVESARDRTFRMKLVYHILRAGGQ